LIRRATLRRDGGSSWNLRCRNKGTINASLAPDDAQLVQRSGKRLKSLQTNFIVKDTACLERYCFEL
jgi:hypothetical protein